MSHNLFNRCCNFAYSDTAMWLKCIWHLKNPIFTQKFAMSATPDYNVMMYGLMQVTLCLTQSHCGQNGHADPLDHIILGAF